MKTLNLLTLILIAFTFTNCSEETIDDFTPEGVAYEVTFNTVWSAQTHPAEFPSNPHFSPLIGMTHESSTELFVPGTNATEGIRNMAETGGQSPLNSEITERINGGSAFDLFGDNGPFNSPGNSGTVRFTAREDFPLVSVVSMIAPSPDWFVGVRDLNLFEDGSWVREVTVVPYVFDAGTDSGVTFNSANSVTNPRQNISLITTPPLATGGTVATMGTFTFRRVE